MKTLVHFIFALCLTSCAASKMVEYNGVKMPLDQAAQLRYAEAEKLYQYKKYDEAALEFKIIASQLKSTNYADNALWRLSQISDKKRQSDQAYRYIKQLIENHPNSDLKYKAHYKAGQYALQSKDELLALSYFSRIPLSSVELSQRKRLSTTIESLAKKNHAFANLSSWYILNYYDPQTVQNRRLVLQQKIITSIASLKTVEEVNAVSIPENQSFPQGDLDFQKAKIYLEQENNESKAKRAFNQFTAAFPTHRYIPKAQNYLQSLGDDQGPSMMNTGIIYIGLLVPLTGPKAHIGQLITKGVILSQDIYQSRYPNAAKVKLLIQDTKGDAQQAMFAFEKLMQGQNKPVAIIGPCYHETTEAIDQLISQYRIPVISMSSSEKINLDNRWLFRNSLTKSEQADGLAYLSKHILNLKRIAILYPDSSYGQEFMQLAQRAFGSNDIEVVKLEPYKTDQSDLTDAVKKLVGLTPYNLRKGEICSEQRAEESKKRWMRNASAKRCYTRDNLPPVLNFEALFIPDGAQRAKRIFPTLRYYNVSGIHVLGTNLWDTPNFIDGSTKKAAQGSFILSAFYKNKRAPHVQSFVQNYTNKFNRDPEVLSAQAYDTASILFSNLFQGNVRSSSDFVRKLKQTENFKGVTGTIRINENGDTQRKLTPLTVDGNQFKEIY